MSAYTTTHITRNAARRYIIDKIISNEISDNQLESFIDDVLLYSRARSCKIVDNDEQNEDEILN